MSSSLRFQIDEAVVDLMLWVEAKAGEKTIGAAPERQPKKGQTWVPKYKTVGEILDLYAAADAEPDLPPVDMTEVAALVAALTDEAEPEF